MKKIIILIFLFTSINISLKAENFVIKGKIIENDKGSIKISDNHMVYNIKGKFPCCKPGDFVKIIINDNGTIVKFLRINNSLKYLRERIKNIKKCRQHRGCGCRYNNWRK